MNPASFRTEFAVPPLPFRLTPSSRVVALGSCFAEVLGNRLNQNKVRTTLNPFGTIFQPLALFNLLEKALRGDGPDERLFLQRDGRWVSFEAHSAVWGRTPDELAAVFREKLQALRADLLAADVLLLTLGTAWAWRLTEPPAYVANNHQQPTARFERDLLSVKDVCKAFANLNSQLSMLNSQLKIVLTVSPVRHGRDGMLDNAVSKSVLRAACHYLTVDFPDVSYFPAYELLLDDLRDYRFYAPDGLHPNEVAQDYIFGKFADAAFSEELKTFAREWEGIRRALGHRPSDEASPAHRAMLEKLKRQLQGLAGRAEVSAELAEVEARLKKFS
jgi:hypothetical protein